MEKYFNERRNPSEAHLELFPYYDEYYTHLLCKESERHSGYHFKARSPQLKYRKTLIKDLKLLNDKLGLSVATFHLAVHFLDVFMDCHEIDTQQLMLAASSCLLISAKYVDLDSNIPRFSQLQSLTNFNNSLDEYKTMERMLLNFWRWDLNFATSQTFLEHLLSCEIFANCAQGLHPSHFESFKHHIMQLSDITLSEVVFIYFKSSLVAASCVAAARIIFRTLHIWPASLENTTGYSYIDIDECVQHILHFFSQSESFFVPMTQLSADFEDPMRLDCKWKCKAPTNSFNCARTKRRHILSRSDLKQMYCAM